MKANEGMLPGFREMLKKEELDALVIPMADPHMSEYLPDHWKVIEWLTGFTGSAGTVVITAHEAMLWTDSRYYIQAELELGNTAFSMMKDTGQPGSGFVDWLAANLEKHASVAVDGRLVPVSKLRQMEDILRPAGIHVLLVNLPFSEYWENRPALPDHAVFEVSAGLVGRTREENIGKLRTGLLKKECDAALLTDLDEICWVLNIRGGDISCNTSVLSYMVVTTESVFLFLDPEKMEDPLSAALERAGVHIRPYGDIRAFLMSMKSGTRWLADPAQVNASLYNLLPEEHITESPSEAMFLKAVKSEQEQESIRRTMILDGVALTQAFMWLEQALEERAVPEYEFASRIAEFRDRQEGYFSESFPAIVGYGAHGAIVHFRPGKNNSNNIKKEGVLLVDSGGHYRTGTTDITRTIALGDVSDDFKKQYTAVLKGHIALASAKFPEGTKGYHLDLLARQFLWTEGLNYGHGTGHGVGFFSSVHEPPYGISPSSAGGRKYPFVPGLVVSNEPGYYKQGAYGIRIENLVLVEEYMVTGEGKFLGFETLTLFPIDLSCVLEHILTRVEVAWLDGYHARVREQLLPHLEGEQEKQWMVERTKPLSRSK